MKKVTLFVLRVILGSVGGWVIGTTLNALLNAKATRDLDRLLSEWDKTEDDTFDLAESVGGTDLRSSSQAGLGSWRDQFRAWDEAVVAEDEIERLKDPNSF